MMRKIGVLAIVLPFVLISVSLDGYTKGIMAGFAKVDITAPTGGINMGYSSAKPTDGVHDPVFAKVLILQSTDTTAALVSWDVCEFQSPWLRDQMEAVGVDHLLMLSTHTHASQNLNQKDFPSEDTPWRRTVEERILETIIKAKQDLFPAYIAAGQGSIQLGYNRLVRQPEGHAITHFENPERIPYGPVDPTVSVLRITDDTGAVRVILVQYACHPVVLGPRNRKISADYPGVMCREVEQHIGGDAQCMFVQGGAGDINPLFLARTGDPELDFPIVETMGKLLAEEVNKTFDRMKSIQGKSDQFACASKVITVDHRWESDKTMQLGVTSILINDDIGIITMPGEPFVDFQFQIRERSTLPFTLLFGYCDESYQDWPWYIPDLESAARGGYGASDTTLPEVGAGEHLVNQGLAQLYKMQGLLKSKPQRHIR